MNEKFRFINVSQDAGSIRDDSFTEFLGTAVTSSSIEQSALTVEKINEMLKLVSTPAKTKNPFFDAFEFKPNFSCLVEDQKQNHRQIIHYPMAVYPANSLAIISQLI